MPSPVGHALAGVIVGLLAGGRTRHAHQTAVETPGRPHAIRRGWLPALFSRTVLLAAAAAVAPDLDFLWGRHNMETHSLGMAALAGLGVVAWTRGGDLRLGMVVALAWASHVLFDWLGSDTTPPLGVMALWPLSGEFYFAHAYVFEAISRRTHLPNFWSHNLWAVMLELLLLLPLAALAAWRAARAGSPRRGAPRA
jgi:membrane-bound metal-dependent hydrolase YbcI (DUF457 family)